MSNKYYVNYGGPSARGWSGSQAIIPRDTGCVKLFWATTFSPKKELNGEYLGYSQRNKSTIKRASVY
ncbi:MAG: hypothetical protein CL779_01405 [Chloroflexi bacterium]|nr:hypothetical protein [Chloroflexota bacterium]